MEGLLMALNEIADLHNRRANVNHASKFLGVNPRGHSPEGGPTVKAMRFLAIPILAVLTLFVSASFAGAGDPDKSDHNVGPGCDPTRTAVAYHAGGPALTSHKGDLPIPCAVVAGSSMETATVGITSEGTLFYAPQSTGAAVPPAVFRSDDDGATWHQKTPTLQPGTGSAIPWMHVDPETNRVWFAMIGPMPS